MIPQRQEASSDAQSDITDREFSLQASVDEQLEDNVSRASKLAEIIHEAWLVPLPSARWSDTDEEALKRYGCTVPRDAMGRGPIFQGVLIVNVLEDFRDLMPDLGQCAIIDMQLPYRPRERPSNPRREPLDCCSDIANSLFDRLVEDETFPQDNIEYLNERITELQQDGLQDSRKMKYAVQQLQDAESDIRREQIQFVKRFCASTVPAEPSAAHHHLTALDIRAATFLDAALSIPDDDDRLTSLIDLCVDYGVQELQETAPEEVVWRGRRIPAPQGLDSSAHYFFAVTAPREVWWTPGFSPPFQNLELPLVDLSGSIDNCINGIVTSQSCQVSVAIRYEANIATAYEELAAVRRAANSQDPLLLAQWHYMQDFRTNKFIDFVTTFPSIAGDTYDADQEQRLGNLSSVPAGMLFAQGDPVAGNTTLAIRLIANACRDPPSVPPIKTMARDEDASDTAVSSDEDIDSGDDDGWIMPEPLVFTPGFRNFVALWVTPSHALCKDIRPKLAAATDGRVIHVYSFEAETAALDVTFDNDIADNAVRDGRTLLTPAEIAMTNTFSYKDDTPSDDPHSLSSVARHFVIDDADNDPELARWRRLQSLVPTNQTTFPCHSEEYEYLSIQLLVKVALSAVVLVGTPLSLGQLGEHLEASSRFTVIDRASRLSESSFWIVPSRYIGPVIAIGYPTRGATEPDIKDPAEAPNQDSGSPGSTNASVVVVPSNDTTGNDTAVKSHG